MQKMLWEHKCPALSGAWLRSTDFGYDYKVDGHIVLFGWWFCFCCGVDLEEEYYEWLEKKEMKNSTKKI